MATKCGDIVNSDGNILTDDHGAVITGGAIAVTFAQAITAAKFGWKATSRHTDGDRVIIERAIGWRNTQAEVPSTLHLKPGETMVIRRGELGGWCAWNDIGFRGIMAQSPEAKMLQRRHMS